MPDKTTRLTILIDAPTKQRLESLSSDVDLTISQVIRKLIRDHLQQHDNPIISPVREPAKEDSSLFS
ncbi:hypothetical protein YA0745_05680 [Pseudomonas synxantha]|uniref:Ribbon-helix-helix protein RHH domain-containing protein n=1 Tax=Pseudomonas synxantha TaxID=47883 RepID=A0ABS0UPX3_9PSED|nr:hypothetical protein [Pseudomonas synxantha]MBI6567339.1 hypothetical protein [Pseudomonas synxantha]MBI6581380.1 hypothetical protein [Pseudomonas synxantha]MBI6642431.1 hypothetical protein [Pseudomonas synxantha]MDQ0977257.1 putative DNA-binding protein [Pseudomonas synxantha]